jgi:hypothetical protein
MYNKNIYGYNKGKMARIEKKQKQNTIKKCRSPFP